MPVTPIDYTLLFGRNYPTALFSGSCETYSKISWKDPIISLPTEAQLISEWVILEVILEKESKIRELSRLSGMDIIAGFRSTALGSSYFYDSDPDSQVNLIGLVSKSRGAKDASYDPVTYVYSNPDPIDYFPIRNNKTDIHKTYTPHTLSQLDNVVLDGANFKLLILQTFNNLKNQVLSCTDIPSIRLIVWTSLSQV